MGQVTPYMIAGVDLARPTHFGTFSPLDAVNNVFSGPGAVQAVGTVGMGVTYQVTPNFSVGVEASVHTNERPVGTLALLALRLLSPERRVSTGRLSLSNDPHARMVPPRAARQRGRRIGRAFRRPRRAQTGAAGQPAGRRRRRRSAIPDVVKRARDLAAAPYRRRHSGPAGRPRQSRFRRLARHPLQVRQAAARASRAANFRLELFHLGHLYKRPVIDQRAARRHPGADPLRRRISSTMAATRSTANLPVNLGFAGFRLHFPLNAPHVWDEVIAFLGASYFRFLGRGQRYGLSARGLGIGAGPRLNEEFPFFREFWIETPDPTAERIVIYALLDGEFGDRRLPLRSRAGPGDRHRDQRDPVRPQGRSRRSAWRRCPRCSSSARTTIASPTTSAANCTIPTGCSSTPAPANGSGARSSNPAAPAVSAFLDTNPRGFGLLQRDRNFRDYQDLELAYELRPSYWIEPHEGWGEGRVELLELPTGDETNDNIVVAWAPKDGLDAGKSLTYGYRITALTMDQRLTPGGARGRHLPRRGRARSAPPIRPPPGATRFLIDFSGGDLSYYMSDPSMVEVVATTSNGRILRTFLTPNAHIRGFRAGVDVAVDPGQSSDLRVFLRAGPKALTETWTFPWRA